MRVARVAGSDPATRSADQLAVFRLYGEGLRRQIPASVLHCEIVERGYQGGLSQLRAHRSPLRPRLPPEPEARFETALASTVSRQNRSLPWPLNLYF